VSLKRGAYALAWYAQPLAYGGRGSNPPAPDSQGSTFLVICFLFTPSPPAGFFLWRRCPPLPWRKRRSHRQHLSSLAINGGIHAAASPLAVKLAGETVERGQQLGQPARAAALNTEVA